MIGIAEVDSQEPLGFSFAPRPFRTVAALGVHQQSPDLRLVTETGTGAVASPRVPGVWSTSLSPNPADCTLPRWHVRLSSANGPHTLPLRCDPENPGCEPTHGTSGGAPFGEQPHPLPVWGSTFAGTHNHGTRAAATRGRGHTGLGQRGYRHPAMPTAPRHTGRASMTYRVCSTPGCPELHTSTGRCPRCRAQADQDRRPEGNPYATPGHQQFREEVLTRDPICVLCMAARSTVADHWPTERRDLIEQGLDPNDSTRGRGLCKRCHDEHTARSHDFGGAH